MAGVCVLCNLVSCVPGFFSSGCTAGSVRDAVCLPCTNTPSSGPYNWTSGCEFKCSRPGFWLNGTECSACSVPSCLAGSYLSDCGGTNNSECTLCPAPAVIGPVRWTRACEYVCLDGYFFLGDSECAACSEQLCFPGYVKTPCKERKDSECLQCSEPAGQFGWTTGCDYVCMPGSYLSINGDCLACSTPGCVPGMYASVCNGTVDSSCVPCEQPLEIGSAWTQRCESACVGGEYWLNGTECQPCASDLVCGPGWNLSVCTPDSDSECVPCARADVSFVWTSGCDFTCAHGFFRRDGLCLPCSLPECGPGTLPVGCTDVSDAVCEECHPPAGAFVWTGGCAFECANGFYLSNGSCVACSAFAVCHPGFRPSACTLTRDVVCEPCPQLSDGYVWTVGCEYSCADGYFVDHGGTCRRCSSGSCAAGTYAVDCTLFSDFACLGCPMPGGAFVWSNGCDFECAGGYFRDGTSICSPCSVPSCRPGTYATSCSRSADAACSRCVAANAPGVAWTVGCEFKCMEGFFRDPLAGCTRCADLKCVPGTFRVRCTASDDARCAPCGALEGVVWIDDACGFRCADGYYQLNASFCKRCSTSMCGPGFYGVGCTASADSRCAQCSRGGPGVVWGADCQFECSPGYSKDEADGCAAIPPAPPVFAMVSTQMDMDNTVGELCSELVSLTKALSLALSLLSNGTIKFDTNVTTLDGQACTENRCPQCLTARRLLAASVSVCVVSQSTVPVQPSAVVLAPPSDLMGALARTLASSVLTVGMIETTVSTRAVGAESVALVAISVFDYLFFLVVLFVLVLCGLWIVCVACIRRCCQIQAYESKRDCGSSADLLFSGQDRRISLGNGRVEAITFRRRSRSRDRDLLPVQLF